MIAARGTAAELKSRVPGDRLDLTLTTSDAYLRATARTPHATHHDPPARTLGIPTDGTARHVRALLDELDPDGTEVESFVLRTATLDDVFLSLTAPRPAAAAHERTTTEEAPTHV
ncbi:hypothetical protein STRAU_0926 [Streptomyces aurantiacus JA 4570]|uniref:Daunorubicin resistance ATP-binding protein DrrA1/2-like C-terminal domain-containing protein n=1 Tax=Streptomyces aurantiacus JA 4570 TaxID=1286094 RepID=S4A5I8_9ACTN|nr:hypothetical protein STRAU_0926 [Streptomyces aurantiacus JA 4570]